MTIPTNGLQWRKVDLHVHTPGSSDHKDKGATSDQIVTAAKNAGLSGFAVTDHNTGQSIDPVKAASRGTGVTVFPGVEVTVNAGKRNIHLLAIFDPSKGTEHVHDFLARVGITQDKRGNKEALAEGDVNQVIGIIESLGGLPLLAHADSASGVLKDMAGQPRIAVVRNEKLLGAELTSPDTARFLDGTDPDYKRKLPYFQGSDSHSLDEIGRRATHFKLGEMTASSLRQCFYDPEPRIRLPAPPESAYPAIVGMRVSGGFFNDLECTFHDGLNAILGGKGVGKSLIIEFLRFALAQPSDVEAIGEDSSSKLAKQLGLGGSVTVTFRLASGALYEVTRTFNEVDDPITASEPGTGLEYAGDIPKLAPILAYSQNEVIDIARSNETQLRLIDRLIDVEPQQSTIRELQASLRKKAASYLEALDASERASTARKDIATLEAQIKELEVKLKSSMFEEKKVWDRQDALLRRTDEIVKEVSSRVEETVSELSGLALPGLGADQTDADLKQVHDVSERALKELRESISKARSAFVTNIEAAKSPRERWAQRRTAWDSAFEEFLKEAGGKQAALSAKRDKAVTNLAASRKALEKDETTAGTLQKHRDDREQLLDALEEAKRALYERRLAVYDDLTAKSDGRIKLLLHGDRNRARYDRALERLFRGLNVQKQYRDAIVATLHPREFVGLIEAGDPRRLVSDCGLTENTAAKIVDALRTDDELRRDVLLLPSDQVPDDEPEILYQKDDGEYYPLAELSVGQKCTALLLIALSEGTMPIIIDQPEDALDVATVYTDVVRRLRAGKDARQFIITTHNPNVAVSSDADKYHVLRSTATEGELVCAGAIDLQHIASEVITQLEGGPDPYRLRGRKYNLT